MRKPNQILDIKNSLLLYMENFAIFQPEYEVNKLIPSLYLCILIL